jgi:uncharacterized protein
MDEGEQTRKLISILRGTTWLMQVLCTARTLDLPDWLVFSGAVYQPILNYLTGRDPGYGNRDYDLAYFDDTDLSYEAEDVVIRRVSDTFDEPLRQKVQVRNQACVHLWFERKFGEAYAPLRSTAQALERFASPLFAVGVRLERDGRLRVEAPFGLADLFELRLRRNPRRRIRGFERIAAGIVQRWPELSVE